MGNNDLETKAGNNEVIDLEREADSRGFIAEDRGEQQMPWPPKWGNPTKRILRKVMAGRH